MADHVKKFAKVLDLPKTQVMVWVQVLEEQGWHVVTIALNVYGHRANTQVVFDQPDNKKTAYDYLNSFGHGDAQTLYNQIVLNVEKAKAAAREKAKGKLKAVTDETANTAIPSA